MCVKNFAGFDKPGAGLETACCPEPPGGGFQGLSTASFSTIQVGGAAGCEKEFVHGRLQVRRVGNEVCQDLSLACLRVADLVRCIQTIIAVRKEGQQQ